MATTPAAGNNELEIILAQKLTEAAAIGGVFYANSPLVTDIKFAIEKHVIGELEKSETGQHLVLDQDVRLAIRNLLRKEQYKKLHGIKD